MKTILKAIEKQDVYQAIEQLDKFGWAKKNDSTKFDLAYEGKSYPPKMVVRYAGIAATGEEPTYFSGGKESNTLLQDLGFTIVDKFTREMIVY